jgi:hypothetical protein
MMIIDPPVGPYSDAGDIRAWLAELADMPQDDESVIRAIADAQRWLSWGAQKGAATPLTPDT